MCHNWLFLKLLPSLTILFCEQDTVDIENANDYYEMVANLAGSEPDRIKVLVDMKTIRSSCRQVVDLVCLDIIFESQLTSTNSEMLVRKIIQQLVIMEMRNKLVIKC